MKKVLVIAVAAVSVVGLAWLASAQGMWGGFDWDRGGMMGGWGGYQGSGKELTLDQAAEAAQRYLKWVGNHDLTLTEVMEFSDNFYAEVVEKSTGTHAFEIPIDRYTGYIHPEPGPNMMWNTKYGHMGGRGMMGFGTMGGWVLFGQRRYDAPMSVTPDQARNYAQRFLNVSFPGTTVGHDADAFYGYYTIHVEKDGKIYGMLSVNGYTGQVWYHNWHGSFIDMKEIEDHQYAGFIIVMIGFLLQWPTLITLLMFPILVMMYVRLARREEQEVRAEFGEEYARYAATTPAFFPRFGRAALGEA